MDINTIVSAAIGGVVGWLSTYLPFVKQIDTKGATKVVTNIITGMIGGTAGATLIGGELLGGSGTLANLDLQSIIGSLVGAGALSTGASGLLKQFTTTNNKTTKK